jgi:sugar phosphate isomerase/epimerase
LRFAICNELFEGWDFRRVCTIAKATGYDGLELAPFTLGAPVAELTRAHRAAIRRTAADLGLGIIGLHWLLAKTEGLHLTSPEPAVRRRTSAYLTVLAELCHELGGTVMVFGSPAQRSLLPGVDGADAMAFAAETIRDILPALERLDLTLCIEPLTRDETDFINSCDEAVQLIDLVNDPHVMLQLDVKSMSSEPTSVPGLIRRHAHRTGHFHANDPNRRGPGFGAVDFKPIFAALREGGYNRWVSVEVFDYSPDPETVARQSLEYMRACQP